jgi:hypothetical protein
MQSINSSKEEEGKSANSQVLVIPWHEKNMYLLFREPKRKPILLKLMYLVFLFYFGVI